jgi:hypothetical protein
MKLRKIGKMTRPNDGNRSFYESIANIHVLTALKYLSHNNSEYVIIGDLAVSYHVKPFMCERIQIVVRDKNKSVFKYFPNNICRGIELHIEDISSLNITEEQYRYIIDTARKSDGFSIASPTVLVSLCLKNSNLDNRSEAYTICSNNPIKVNELFGHKTECIDFINKINFGYKLKYLTNLDDYFKCKVYEGDSGYIDSDVAFKILRQNNTIQNAVLIGGLVLVDGTIEKVLPGSDFIFLVENEESIPVSIKDLDNIKHGFFIRESSNIEINFVTANKINISQEFADLIFKTSYIKDNFKIASPSAIVALKLGRFLDRDEKDIVNLIQNYEVDISIYEPYLSEDEISNYEICLKQAIKKED